MEYIDSAVGIRSPEEIVKACGGINTDLKNCVGETALYSPDLLKEITEAELYVLTKDGKAYPGDSVKCIETKSKDLIGKDTVKVIYNESTNTLQFMAFFKDGTAIDARGHYAKNKLIIFKRKRKGVQK